MRRRRTGPILAASVLAGAVGGLFLRANVQPTAVPYVLAGLALVALSVLVIAVTARRSG